MVREASEFLKSDEVVAPQTSSARMICCFFYENRERYHSDVYVGVVKHVGVCIVQR